MGNQLHSTHSWPTLSLPNYSHKEQQLLPTYSNHQILLLYGMDDVKITIELAKHIASLFEEENSQKTIFSISSTKQLTLCLHVYNPGGRAGVEYGPFLFATIFVIQPTENFSLLFKNLKNKLDYNFGYVKQEDTGNTFQNEKQIPIVLFLQQSKDEDTHLVQRFVKEFNFEEFCKYFSTYCILSGDISCKRNLIQVMDYIFQCHHIEPNQIQNSVYLKSK